MNIIQIYRKSINIFQKFVFLLNERLSIILVIKLINAENPFIASLFYYSKCFEHYVLIVGESKLYYKVSGIVTPVHSRTVHSPLSTSAPDGRL